MMGISETHLSPLPPTSPIPDISQTMSSPAEALKQVYSRYVGALQVASDFLRDDLPSASPGVAKWAQETGRRACRKYARQRGSIPFLTSDPSWDGICSGYWEAISEGPTSGGSYETPFSGGQCSVAYRVFCRSFVTPGNAVGQNICTDLGIAEVTPGGGVMGPIRGIRIASTTIGGNPGEQAWLQYGNGQEINLGTRFKGCLQPFQAITSIVRVDGQSDNCGDPPPEYRPPSYPPNLPPLPPPTNPAPGLGNNWDVNILPDGNLEICIGGECSTGTPPGGGGGPDSGGGPGEPDGPPQENDPNDPNDPNEITGCVEEGNILTGLKIELTDIPSGSKVTDGNYYGVCWVYMGPAGDKLDLISDGRWVYDGQFFLPDSDSCTCYKVKVRYPWGIRVQAFSRPKEE